MTSSVRLAFAVVYLGRPTALPIIARHLEFIERYAPDCEWWIEAVAHRAPQSLVAELARRPFVRLHNPFSVPVLRVSHSPEHAAYLDALVAKALAAGATHVCTLDEDSFPVRADWFAQSAARLAEGHSLVAPSRVENGDSNLPHPSCLLTTAAFLRAELPRFLPDRNKRPRYEAWRKGARVRHDTGAGYAFALARSGRSWAKLLRSNAVDDHPLMCGLYDDIVFHFGAASRSGPFVRDLVDLPPDGKERETVLAERVAANQAFADVARQRVETDMDGYLRHLRGE